MQYFIALVMSFVLIGCGQNSSHEIESNQNLLKSLSETEIRVVDDKGNPVAGATVMIGYEKDSSFPNNILITQTDGSIEIPSDWQTEEPVTIQAENFVRATYLHQKPEARVYTVRPLRGQPSNKVHGITSGYGSLKRDDKIDFGLLLPLMSKSTFFQFDLSLFISNDMDLIEIMGQKLYVPSNVSLPDQSERYLFFTIRFNKPQYRLYFHEEGNFEVIAAHGRFPFKRMIDEFQDGKGFTEVVNLFDFLEGGLHVVNTGLPSDQTLAVNTFKFQGAMSVKAPQLPQDYSYFVAPLHLQNSLLYPSDVKRLGSHEAINLKTSPVHNGLQLLAAVVKEEKLPNGASRLNPSMSIAVRPYVNGETLTYLPLTANPQIQNGTIKLDHPTNTNLKTLGTYVSLQDVKVKMHEDTYVEEAMKLWEFYSDRWESEIRLPLLQEELRVLNMARWESMFLANSPQLVFASELAGPAFFEMAEYVSRNATDL